MSGPSVDKYVTMGWIMPTSDNSRLQDLLSQLIDLDKEEDSVVDEIIQVSLTAMLVFVIRKNTTKQERNDLIELSLDRFRENASSGYSGLRNKPVTSAEFYIQLDENLDKARKQLRSLLTA